MNVDIAVPSSADFFEGHFPGRPILPGVTQLVLVLETLQCGTRERVALRGVAFARLRQLVLPGDRLQLAARELDAERMRIDLKRDGVLITNGELILGRPRDPEPVPSAEVAASICAPPSLDALLPHRAPMRFVTSILGETAGGLSCAARIPAGCPLVSDGSVPALVGLEAAAQAAAAWEALRRWREGGTVAPRVGYLVALRDIALFAQRIPADRNLLTCVQLEAAAPPLTHYGVSVSMDGMLVLRGSIATFLTQAGGDAGTSPGGVER